MPSKTNICFATRFENYICVSWAACQAVSFRQSHAQSCVASSFAIAIVIVATSNSSIGRDDCQFHGFSSRRRNGSRTDADNQDHRNGGCLSLGYLFRNRHVGRRVLASGGEGLGSIGGARVKWVFRHRDFPVPARLGKRTRQVGTAA